MEKTLQALAREAINLDALVSEIVGSLDGKVSLTSGFALHEIWALCLPRGSDLEAADLAHGIETLLNEIPRALISKGESSVRLNAKA